MLDVTSKILIKFVSFQVTATDLDSGSNGQITYSISRGNNGDAFLIDSTGTSA